MQSLRVKKKKIKEKKIRLKIRVIKKEEIATQ